MIDKKNYKKEFNKTISKEISKLFQKETEKNCYCKEKLNLFLVTISIELDKLLSNIEEDIRIEKNGKSPTEKLS